MLERMFFILIYLILILMERLKSSINYPLRDSFLIIVTFRVKNILLMLEPLDFLHNCPMENSSHEPGTDKAVVHAMFPCIDRAIPPDWSICRHPAFRGFRFRYA